MALKLPTRNTFMCSASTLRLIELFGEPGDVILSFRKPVVDAVEWAQRSLGYEYPATETRHVALYAGEGKVIHAHPFNKANTGGIRLESMKEAYFNTKICIIRHKPKDQLTWTRQSGDIVEIARSLCGGNYDYSEVLKIGFASAYNIWNRNFGDNTPSRSEKTRKNLESLQLAYTCSKLIFDSYEYVLGVQNPLNNPDCMFSPFVLPAMFYINAEFDDARIENGKLCF